MNPILTTLDLQASNVHHLTASTKPTRSFQAVKGLLLC